VVLFNIARQEFVPKLFSSKIKIPKNKPTHVAHIRQWLFLHEINTLRRADISKPAACTDIALSEHEQNDLKYHLHGHHLSLSLSRMII
jgi:hypothetical protein